ncbi:MAG: ATP-binding cassette domain-containing protein [Alphaproteobacteria bacterium]|nr:ATP-binding cassette domain-containing protein [Alphaproteobacteria bacterium]
MRYGTGPEVLREVTFTLKPGSFHFLTGRSGAGKSSLLKLMYLAHRPSRGLVTLFDEDIATLARNRLPFVRRRVGVVFQEFRLLNHLSAFDNVALPLRVAGVKESTIRKHVDELLSWTGLGDHMDARPPTLSGGQQQRVAIARAMANDPPILVADEPTGSLDSVTAASVLRVFEALVAQGKTVLLVTHDRDIASRATRAVTLADGEIVET